VAQAFRPAIAALKRCATLGSFAVVALLVTACGRKGPPLPPLVKLPAAPAEMKAERHGGMVDIQFIVPATNTDGTRPANVERIDVYGMTATRALDEADVIRHGAKIASLPVKAPRDPNQTIEPEEAEDLELRGQGLDQGAHAHVTERLTADAQRPVDVTTLKTREPVKTAPAARPEGPLLAPVIAIQTRVYVGVSVTTKGRNGPTAHAVVAMIDAPPALDMPSVTYDEHAVKISWPPLQLGPTAGSPTDGELPSTPFGITVPRVAYNVYEVPDTPDTPDGKPAVLTRLTPAPLKEPRLSDPRITWGERRCYAVRALVTIEDVSLEGDESAPSCVTLTDTFPPAAPQGLQAVPSDAAISLIWDANPESDVRGYIVLRGLASADKLEPLTSEPIQDTSFQDRAPSGVRFAYAVQAVDNAGNVSPMSARVEETAR